MHNCPIIKKEMKPEECEATIYTVNSGLKEDEILRRIKRINGWKFICRNCKHFKNE